MIESPVFSYDDNDMLDGSCGFFVVLIVCLGAALFAPWVAPHNPFDLATLNLSDALSPPRWLPGARPAYLLGTDDQGRDILVRLAYGARISLSVGVLSVALAALGCVVAIAAWGFYHSLGGQPLWKAEAE